MKRLYASALAASVVAISVISGGAAVASETEPDQIAGYTKDQFVSAAVASDVPAHVAESAWGDEAAMMGIPVSTHTYAVSNNPKSLSAAAAATWITRSGTCFKEQRNVLNQILWKMTVTKTWKTNQGLAAVQAVSASVGTPTLSWGWSYGGLVHSSDTYSGTSHVTVRSGNFTNNFPDTYTTTVTVTARGNLNGTIGCS